MLLSLVPLEFSQGTAGIIVTDGANVVVVGVLLVGALGLGLGFGHSFCFYASILHDGVSISEIVYCFTLVNIKLIILYTTPHLSLRALPRAHGQISREEHVHEVLELVGDLEPEPLAHDDVPGGAEPLVQALLDHLGGVLVVGRVLLAGVGAQLQDLQNERFGVLS